MTSNEKRSSNLTVEVQIVCGKFQRFNVINRCIEILKLVEFSKISIKIKNCKTFCKAQRANRLNKFILERLDKYKNFVCLKYHFQKKNSQYEILNNLYFGLNFVFFGTRLGHFSQCFFLIFRRPPTIVTDIFTQPSPPP